MRAVKFMTKGEIARFMDAVRARTDRQRTRDVALFSVLINTGLRVTEALELVAGSLLMPELLLEVRTLKRRAGQPKWDHQPIPRATARELAAWTKEAGREAGDLIFQISRRQVHRLFRYYLERSGVDPDGKRKLVPHSLRHTYAMTALRRTGSLPVVMGLLRHTAYSSTQVYADTAALAREARMEPVA